MDIPKILKFLTGLKENNTKVWFDANKSVYDHSKQEWLAIVKYLINEIALFDPEIGGLEPKDCVFRINRDVRFSKDKSPYKTNFGASFTVGGKKTNLAGYYFHLEPGASFVAGGMWMPEPKNLYSIRQEIDYRFEEFKSIIENRKFQSLLGEMEAEKLTNVPKGFEKDSPAAEFLKFKSFVFSSQIADHELTHNQGFMSVIQTFRALKPFNDFLNTALEK